MSSPGASSCYLALPMASTGGVVVVYVDQCHLSRIAKANLGRSTDPDELALFELLVRLVEAGKVACPYSFWHILETAAYDDEEARNEIVRVVGVLSQGRCFKWPFDVVMDEMGAALDSSKLGTGPQTIQPIGNGVDCFPRDVIRDYVHEHIGKIAATERFHASVTMGREAPQIRAQAAHFSSIQHEIETEMASARNANRLSLEEARAIETDAFVNGDMITGMVTRVAEARDWPRPEVRRLVLRDELSHLPTLAMMAEIRARRDVAFGRKPTLSDGFDIGHLLALPYCDYVLTEKYIAELAREAGKLCKTTVLSQPAQLLAELASRFPT